MSAFDQLMAAAQPLFDDAFASRTLIMPTQEGEFSEGNSDGNSAPRTLVGVVARNFGTEEIRVGQLKPFAAPVSSEGCVISYRADLLGERGAWPKRGWKIHNLETGELFRVINADADHKGRVNVYCVAD